MHDPPDLEDCRAAARTLAGQIHRTPIFASRSLGEIVGRPVSLKAELFQRTGSFKLRGMNTTTSMPASAHARAAAWA